MSKILEINNITKIYKIYKKNSHRLKELFFNKHYHKEFIANKNISFYLNEGETLGIIGTNGAGKSTILKIIAGVVTPTSGKIIKKGRVTALLELGSGFNNEASGLDNIFLNGTLIGMSKEECQSKKNEIIAFSELGDYIYEPIKTYSSGMKMRLAFSIAIFSNPKVLIVDEALSVGDAHFQAKCVSALKERKKRNMSIIYVSHDLNSLKLLSDRVIMLNKGELVDEGSPEDVINHYNFLIAKLNDGKNDLQISDNNKDAFGTFDIEIKDVLVYKNNKVTKEFETGDRVMIVLKIYSRIETDDLTIGISIRDKFAQDIYGTNTYYQNKKLTVKRDTMYQCEFTLDLNIGVGQYSLSTALHTSEGHTELCYHWKDNAISFQVTPKKEDFFIGLCKLSPLIDFKKVK